MLCVGFSHVFCGSETSTALLVKLGTGCHSVNGHVDTDLGLDDLCDDAINVMHDPHHHISLGKFFGYIQVGRMRTSVNDTIHIQIQMVEFRQQGGVGNNLVDLWIPLADPSVKLSSQEQHDTSVGINIHV